MAKIWDDEETVSEYDLIAEDAQKAEELAEEYASKPSVVEADEEQLEEIAEESAFELNHNESNVIYNARLRLEQAKLYELLINHNLFEGVDASPEAIKNVQNELKFYIVKRLEILLGIREPVVRVESAVAELPFNDIEIDFLKQLAYKGTFGKSEEGEPVKLAPKAQAIKPVTPAQKLKAMTVKRVEKQEPVAPPAPPPEKPKAPEAKKQASPQPAPTKTVAPQQKAPAARKPGPKPKVRESGMGRELTRAEAEEIAKADIKTSSGKPFHEMTAKEKAAKIREVNDRHKRPQATGAVPMPTPDQLKMKYLTQQESQSYSKNQTNQFNTILASALAAKKNRGDDDGE
jgi:hypothetical protein